MTHFLKQINRVLILIIGLSVFAVSETKTGDTRIGIKLGGNLSYFQEEARQNNPRLGLTTGILFENNVSMNEGKIWGKVRLTFDCMRIYSLFHL